MVDPTAYPHRLTIEGEGFDIIGLRKMVDEITADILWLSLLTPLSLGHFLSHNDTIWGMESCLGGR